jgi:SRSO17 transposase
VDNAVIWGQPFLGKKWRKIQLQRNTLPPQTWEIKAEQVYLARDGSPTERTYWLIVARNRESGEIKYFVSNAPPHTSLEKLLKVAFSRWNVEHAYRLVKTEIGFGHFEGRSWLGLLRHPGAPGLFVAEQTTRLRGEKSRPDHGADGPRFEPRLPALAAAAPRRAGP